MLAATAAWLAPVLIVGALGVGLPTWAASVTGILAALALGRALAPGVTSLFSGPIGANAAVRLALALGVAVAIYRVASLGVFMAHAGMPQFSMRPEDPFRAKHSCFSSYAEAARFLEAGGPIYDRSLYQPRVIGPLNVDPYHYPPPFLLLPQALRQVTADFWNLRRMWFSLQAAVLALVIVSLAVWLGGTPGLVALIGGVVILALPTTLFALQQGNFQVTAASLAMGGVMLLANRRFAAGAALVAYASLAKIFPGILVVFLAGARRWRALGWVTVAGIVLIVATLGTQGWKPTHDFVTHALPEISSGAAFAHAEERRTAAANWTIYGEAVRLRHLGFSSFDRQAGLRLASVYGVLVIALAAFAGFRSRFGLDVPDRRALALATISLVALAAFRSPFAGGPYASVATLWTMTLLAAGAATVMRAAVWLAATVALSLLLWMVPSPNYPQPAAWLWGSGAMVLAGVAVNLWALWTAVAIFSTTPASPSAVPPALSHAARRT